MTCPYRGKYEKGYRAFSDRVPGYAQGAYFPGDEPGYRCKASGELCGNPDGDTPEDCAVQEETEFRCPHCGGTILRTPLEVYYCGVCYELWNNKQEMREAIEAQKEIEDEYADPAQ